MLEAAVFRDVSLDATYGLIPSDISGGPEQFSLTVEEAQADFDQATVSHSASPARFSAGHRAD